MASLLQTAAASVVVPKIARRFKFSWLLYGAAAYFGIRYLNRKGILPKETGFALNAMDKGIDSAKQHLSLQTETHQKENAMH
jgi:hypothetical protein